MSLSQNFHTLNEDRLIEFLLIVPSSDTGSGPWSTNLRREGHTSLTRIILRI